MDDTLTQALATIKRLAFPAFGFLAPVTTDIFWWAAGFAVFFGLLAWICRPTADPVQLSSTWVSLLYLMYFVSLMMRDFVEWSTAYIGFMAGAGVDAAGGGLMHGLEDISAVVSNGWNASAALWKALNSFSIYTQTGSFLLVACAVAFVLIGHVILAYRLIKLFGEYYLLSVIAFLSLPFAVWRMTLFMAAGPARYIISTGLSIAAIGFGYGLTHALVGRIVYDPSLMAGSYFGKSVAMLLLLLIVADLPKGISSFLNGGANTSFGNEAGNLMWTATSAASLARGAMALAAGKGAAPALAGGGGGGSQLPGGITFNPGFRQGSSSGSGGPNHTAVLTNSSNVRRTP